jgi:signal transduction histidine kinase
VRLDRHKLFQILTNLLSNARHAVDERQDAAGEHAITVRAAPGAGDRLVIEVEDTGSGIAPENLARIFTHGFTTKKDGHGFGLHSSALAAMEMGGSLEAHSAGTGKGARFVLQLPLVAERRGEEASGARPERSAEHTADAADSRSVPASRP